MKRHAHTNKRDLPSEILLGSPLVPDTVIDANANTKAKKYKVFMATVLVKCSVLKQKMTKV